MIRRECTWPVLDALTASMTTISPGSTSRTYSASMMSNADGFGGDDERVPFRPMARGRNPAWSRAAISLSSVRMTMENAPSHLRERFADLVDLIGLACSGRSDAG